MDTSNLDAVSNAITSATTGVSGLISLVITVLTIVAMWKIFVKAGKPGWGAIIPFYNTFCLFDMTFGSGWLFLLLLIPCVNVVMMIIMYFKLAKAFGHGAGYGFGLIFLNTIFILILGFGSDTYQGVPGKN